MKKKKILHLIHSEIGGAGDVAFSINDLNCKSFNSDFLLTGPKLFYGFKKKIKKLKKKIFYQSINKGSHFLKVFDVFKKLKLINPDIVIVHNYQILPCFLFKLFNKKKIIYVDHMSLSLKKIKDYICIFFSFLFFDKVIFINKENFKKFKFFNKYKSKFIFNTISSNFKSEKKYKNQKFFKIGISGRINHLKNHQLIIDVLRSDIILQKKVKVFIAGSGELKSSLKREIKILNLQKNFIFNGELDHEKLKKWFKKIDLYLHLSFGEGMSTSILQAMSSSTPVLASNVNGINNFIGKKKHLGLLFKNNINDLKKKIIYFMNITNKEYFMFQKVQKKYFLKNHSFDLFLKKYKKVLREI